MVLSCVLWTRENEGLEMPSAHHALQFWHQGGIFLPSSPTWLSLTGVPLVGLTVLAISTSRVAHGPFVSVIVFVTVKACTSRCPIGPGLVTQHFPALLWNPPIALTAEMLPSHPLQHQPLTHPRFSSRNTQQCKMSSGGSGLAFVSPPIHYFTSPLSQVHNLYQQWNELHEKVRGMAGTSGPHTVRATVS